MNKTIIIADDNQQFCKNIKEFFLMREGYDIVGIASNGIQAIDLVNKYNPDFLILDIVMPEMDGFGVLSALTNKKTIVIMTSQLTTDGFVQKALQYGASYFLAKPFDSERLLNLLDDLSAPRPSSSRISSLSMRSSHSLDEKITNLFITVGIPAHIKGYQFLREAIKITIDTPDIINSITKRLYPSIAERFSTTPSKVERAIRHAIEVAWSRGKIENINTVFGIKIYSPNEKPTNSEFIALIADKLMLECA